MTFTKTVWYMMKIGRKHTQGFCIKPDYWRGQAPPSEILGGGGGPVAPLASLVPTPLHQGTGDYPSWPTQQYYYKLYASTEETFLLI